MGQIYFDYAATTPVDPEVLKTMLPFFTDIYGNAGSAHSIGRQAGDAVENARTIVAQTIGAKTNEIIFNSGATESANHALCGVAESLKHKGKHIIVSAIEHHCVLEPAEFLEREGFQVTYLSVDKTGRVDPQNVKDALQDDTILVAIMHANNEIGVIQPIKEIADIVHERGILLLVDAVQSVGHIPVKVDALGVDLLSMSAHKFYGPKGIGALYIRSGTLISSFLRGGSQETGRRASTQNVPGIVGLGKSLELCITNLDKEMKEQIYLRDKLIQGLQEKIEGVVVNGDLKKRLPNNIHVSFNKVSGESLLMSLDMQGFAASMGSACSAGAVEISHVLRAIGLTEELALGTLRLTLGRWSKGEHIDQLLDVLPNMIVGLRL